MSTIYLFNFLRFNGSTGQWEPAMPPNLACNIYMDFEGGETVKGAFEKMQLTPGPKGDTGNTGADGASAYVHIRWGTSAAPAALLTTPSDYIGIASTSNATAPASYTDYAWYKYKGETGAAGATGATGAQGLKGDNGTPYNPGFDSLHYRNGLTGTVATSVSTVTETIKITSNGAVLAVRTTAGLDTDSIAVTTQFFAQTFTLDGVSITTKANTDTKTINLSTLAW